MSMYVSRTYTSARTRTDPYPHPHPPNNIKKTNRKKEQERHHAVELREKASAKYTRGISEALVRVMKERGACVVVVE